MDRSTKTWGECWVDYLLYLFATFICYNSLIFRSLPNFTYFQSKIFLWVLIAISNLGFLLILYRKERTSWTVAMTIVTPFGFYTTFAYINTFGTLLKVILCAALILWGLFVFFIFSRKSNQGISFRKVVQWRVNRSVFLLHTFTTFGFLLIIGWISFQSVLGPHIIDSSVNPLKGKESEQQTISNNIETILLLQEEKWVELTVQEKIDVLQVVANIEVRFLGLPNELVVGVSNLSDDTTARYNDNIYTVSIDLNYLETETAYDVLCSCLHEVYHSYQHRLVEAYNTVDENLKTLQIFRSAEKYNEEFLNYDDGEEDYYSYYTQNCESDAREYAINAANDYYNRIDEYLSEISS